MIAGVLMLHNISAAQWDTISGLPLTPSLLDVHFSNNGHGTMLNSTTAGIGGGWVTFDNGYSWTEFGALPYYTIPRKVIFMTPTHALAACADWGEDGAFLRSVDAGITWTVVDSGSYTDVSMLNAQEVLLLEEDSAGVQVYKSNDGGTNFSLITTLPGEYGELKVVNSTVIYLITGRQNWGTRDLFRSDDAGLSWSLVKTGWEVRGFDAGTPMVIAGCTGGTIEKSNDGGITWSTIDLTSLMTAGGGLEDIEFYDGLNAVAVCTFATTSLEIFISSDGGDSWQQSFNNAAVQDGNGYAYEAVDYNALGHVFAVSWQHAIVNRSIVGIEGSAILKEQNALVAIPNPAANKVQFRAAAGNENRQVRLKLSDISGKLLISIPNQNLQDMVLDISQLPNGIYLYRIESNEGFMRTGKLLVQH
jgi:hypothetical protein